MRAYSFPWFSMREPPKFAAHPINILSWKYRSVAFVIGHLGKIRLQSGHAIDCPAFQLFQMYLRFAMQHDSLWYFFRFFSEILPGKIDEHGLLAYWLMIDLFKHAFSIAMLNYQGVWLISTTNHVEQDSGAPWGHRPEKCSPRPCSAWLTIEKRSSLVKCS